MYSSEVKPRRSNLLTPKVVSQDYLPLGYQRVLKLMKRGELRAVRINDYMFFTTAEWIDEYLASVVVVPPQDQHESDATDNVERS